MADDPPGGPDDLNTAFVFVKRGDPPPLDWMAQHPGWVKFPAVMIPRDSPHHLDKRAYPPVSASEDEAAQIANLAPDPATVQAGEESDGPVPPVAGTRQAADPVSDYRRSNDAIDAYLAVNARLDAHGLGHSSDNKPPAVAANPDRRTGDRPGITRSSVASPPAKTTNPDRTVIFIGGAGDATSEIVSRYYDTFRRNHPDIAARYFSQNDNTGIIADINGLKPGAPVTVVGHSWGGDTAMEVVKALPPGRVQTLVTIDPVGSGGRPFLRAVAQHAGRWIDVDAVGGKWYDLSNLVSRDLAALIDGRKYGAAPSKFTKDFLASNHAHCDFEQMMNEIDPATGQKIADIVAGKTKQ